MSETIKVGRHTFRVLYPDLLRALTTVELAALEASVLKDGVKVPALVDGEMGVIDGANRLRLAAEHGLDAPWSIVSGLTTAQKRDLAVALNVCRRHLTPAEQAAARQGRVERVAAKRHDGQSVRAIAETEGIDPKQVRRDLAKAGERQGNHPGGDMSPPEGTPCAAPSRVEGRDGKSYPAAVPLADGEGVAVPEPLRPIFEARREFRELSQSLADAAKKAEQLCQSDAGFFLRVELRSARAELAGLRKRVEFYAPYALCPDCLSRRKAKCACQGQGWLYRALYHQTEAGRK